MGQFYLLLVLLLHEQVEGFGLLELLEEVLEFLILFIPLLLFHTHYLQTLHYLLVVLQFSLLCDLMLDVFLHLLFLQFPLPFLLLYVIDALLKTPVVLVDLSDFLYGLSGDWMVWRVVVVALLGDGLDFL